MQYGEKIRIIREEYDLTQSDLAKIINTNQRRISRIETGQSEITLDELKQICIHFKISADFILGILNNDQ